MLLCILNIWFIFIAPAYDDSSLTEAEKLLLLICQTEASANKKEIESVTEVVKEEQPQDCVQMDQHIQADTKSPTEPSIECTADKEVLISENENLSDNICHKICLDICHEIPNLVERKESDHEHVNKEPNKDNEDISIKPTNGDTLNYDIIDDVTNNAPPTTKVDAAEASGDFDLKEITKDLNKTVTHIEAKCAGVREELGQMAMSEQYMRTKQAQLMAKRREKEAERALQMATKKEQEAQVNFIYIIIAMWNKPIIVVCPNVTIAIYPIHSFLVGYEAKSCKYDETSRGT